jgi:hypothetical protein
MYHTSVALTAQYLNIYQCKIDIIIIEFETVHMLQHDIVDTGSLLMEVFFKHNPSNPARQ